MFRLNFTQIILKKKKNVLIFLFFIYSKNL